MSSLIKFLNINICSLLIIFLAGAASVAIDSITPEIVGLVDLKTGARLALIMLFSYWVVPGILLGSIATSLIFLTPEDVHGNVGGFIATIETIVPYIAFAIMHALKLDKFSADSRMSYPHLVGLCVLTSLLSSIAMFFIMTGVRLSENYQHVEHLTTHLTGTLLGTFFAFFVCLLMSKAFMENLKKV